MYLSKYTRRFEKCMTELTKGCSGDATRAPHPAFAFRQVIHSSPIISFHLTRNERPNIQTIPRIVTTPWIRCESCHSFTRGKDSYCLERSECWDLEVWRSQSLHPLFVWIYNEKLELMTVFISPTRLIKWSWSICKFPSAHSLSRR